MEIDEIMKRDLDLYPTRIKNVSCESDMCLLFEVVLIPPRNDTRTKRYTDYQHGVGLISAGVGGFIGMATCGPPCAIAGAGVGYVIGSGTPGRRKRDLNNECTLLGMAFVVSDKDSSNDLTFDEIRGDQNLTEGLTRIDSNNDEILQPEEIHPCLTIEKIEKIRKNRKNGQCERNYVHQLYYLKHTM